MDDSPDRSIRVSDQDRNAMVEVLRDHLTEGRLTTEEFSDRVEAALAARTRGELADLTGDLPALASTVSGSLPALPPDGRHQRWTQARNRIASFVMPNAVCISIWAMTGRGAFWPEWVLFGTGIPFLGWVLRGEVKQRRVEEGEAEDPDRDDPAVGTGSVSMPGPADDGGGRRFASVAFVDVVNSTGWALELGDRGWSELLARHLDRANQEMGAESGQLIFQKGDEIVAAFDRPGRAIRWASAVRRSARDLGLDVRAGVHAGEVESKAGQLSGVALHIGQRVSAAAAAGEILVTSTVEELVAGSGIPLVDGGIRELKGLDRPWRVFSVAEA